MVYVIEQRLKMQNISMDKSETVLTEIAAVMFHPNLLEELFLPQPVAPHAAIKQLIIDISLSSIMKLDDVSLNKLWDLITMIFKWQITVTTNQNILDITRRHLKNVATLMPSLFPKKLIKDAANKFEILVKKITEQEFKALNETLLLWFSDYYTKISVLLRLGLQNKDGSFKSPSIINMKFLINIGENIYTHDNRKSIDDYEVNTADDNEISCLLGPITAVSPSKLGMLRSLNTVQIKTVEKLENKETKLTNGDLTFVAELPRTTQEDLLAMLENYSTPY
ncbi:unnamed protein product [Leptosia nina]|uniref:Uncharacterized protein n=1 Tax=Leptosia nina TaxID=320188 RepID=A0AAV1K2P4_9NEOP